jgi:hypothetical protein
MLDKIDNAIRETEARLKVHSDAIAAGQDVAYHDGRTLKLHASLAKLVKHRALLSQDARELIERGTIRAALDSLISDVETVLGDHKHFADRLDSLREKTIARCADVESSDSLLAAIVQTVHRLSDRYAKLRAGDDASEVEMIRLHDSLLALSRTHHRQSQDVGTLIDRDAVVTIAKGFLTDLKTCFGDHLFFAARCQDMRRLLRQHEWASSLAPVAS